MRVDIYQFRNRNAFILRQDIKALVKERKKKLLKLNRNLAVRFDFVVEGTQGGRNSSLMLWSNGQGRMRRFKRLSRRASPGTTVSWNPSTTGLETNYLMTTASRILHTPSYSWINGHGATITFIRTRPWATSAHGNTRNNGNNNTRSTLKPSGSNYQATPLQKCSLRVSVKRGVELFFRFYRALGALSGLGQH